MLKRMISLLCAAALVFTSTGVVVLADEALDAPIQIIEEQSQQPEESPALTEAAPGQQPASEPEEQGAEAEQPKLLNSDEFDVYEAPNLELELEVESEKEVLGIDDSFNLYLTISDWGSLKENSADKRFFQDEDEIKFYNSYGLDAFTVEILSEQDTSEIWMRENTFLPQYIDEGKDLYDGHYMLSDDKLSGMFEYSSKNVDNEETQKSELWLYKLHPLDTVATDGRIIKLRGQVRKSVSVEKAVTYCLGGKTEFAATIGRMKDGYKVAVQATFNTPSATVNIDTIAPRVELKGDAVVITDAFLDEAAGVVVNGEVVKPSVLDEKLNKYQVELPEGSDSYQVSVTDLAGNKTEKTFYPAALSGATGNGYVEAGQDYRFTLNMEDGDELLNLSVKVGGVSLSEGEGYTQDGNTYTIPAARINGKIEVTANYQKQPHSISVVQPANGAITTEPVNEVKDGESVAYTITANEGYYIASYTVNGNFKPNSDQGIDKIEDAITDVHGDITISAEMKKRTFTVTLKAPENAVVDGSLMQTVEYGEDAVFTITPNEGYEFDSAIGGIYNKVTHTLTVSAVKEDKEISIGFKLKQFTVTLSQPDNATVQGELTKTVSYGEAVEYIVTPDEGYEFDSASGGGYDAATHTFRVAGVKADQSVSIRFKLKEYVITIPEATGAKIAVKTADGQPVANGDRVKHGSSIQAEVEAEVGYTIEKVIGFMPIDAQNQLKQSGTAAVKSDLTISAAMAAKQYAVSATIKDGADKGAVAADKKTAAITDTVTFTITPNEGKEVLSFSVNGESFLVLREGGEVAYKLSEHVKEHQVTGVEGVASFGNKSYDIAISKTGNGVVSDTPDGTGDISPIRVEDGADKTVYIKAAEGSYIASYTVNGKKTTLVGQETAAIEVPFKNVTSNQELSVEFGIKSYRVKVDAVGGSITGEAERTVNHGGSVSFVVKPNEGYEFASVAGEGKYDPATNRLTIDSVTGDLDITVNFKIKIFTVALGQITNGTLGEGQANTLTVDYGGKAEFTVLPNEGYELDRLSAGASYDAETNKLTVSDVKKDHTIDISFKVMTFTVTTGRPQHGTITLSSSRVDYNGSASAQIRAAEGYYIASYTVNGKTTENNDQSLTEYQVELSNIRENQRIDATFAIKSFVISAEVGENGAVTIRPEEVSYGGSAEVEIAANEGYYIASYTDVNGQTVENTDQNLTQVTLRFRNVKENKSVEAAFAIKRYTVRVTAVNGTIDGEAAVVVNHGDEVQFQVRANTGYVFSQELTGAAYDAETGILTVQPVTADRRITLTFTPAAVELPTEEMETLPELIDYEEYSTADLTASAGKRLTGAQLLEMLQAVQENETAAHLVFLTDSGMVIGVPVQILEKLATAEDLDNLAKFISGMNQKNAFAFGLLEERESNLGKGRLDESNARSITFNLNETIPFGYGIDLVIPAKAAALEDHPLYVYRSAGSGLTLKQNGEAEYSGENGFLLLTEVENSAVYVVSTYQIKSGSSHSSGSGSSSSVSASEYWASIKDRAESAVPGATILIRMQGEDVIPADVIAAFAGKDVTLEFERGNDSFAVNGKQLEKPEQNRIYYRFLDLKERYAGVSPVQPSGAASANPETGGFVTVSIPQGAVNDIVPSDLYVDESGMLSDTESGTVLFTPEQTQLEMAEKTGVPFAAILAAVVALVAGGTIFYVMKRQSTSRK